MTLLELAERCERAEGPDRELDFAIHNATRTGAVRRYHSADYKPKNAKLFTASLDAALTLVPEGWVWLLNNYDGDEDAPCSASVAEQFKWEWVHCLGAATPALALLAAICRARHTMEGLS